MTQTSKRSIAKKFTLGIAAAALSITALTASVEAKPSIGIYIGDPLPVSYYGDYDDYGYGYGHRHRRCHWLKKKAMWTGSHYWWREYRRCMRRHYY